MTRLPFARVEGPGNQANWDDVAQKNLLPDIGDARLTLFGERDGWKALDGQAISRTTYREAFLLFGTTHGAGDGTATFNLPDWTASAPSGGTFIVRVV